METMNSLEWESAGYLLVMPLVLFLLLLLVLVEGLNLKLTKKFLMFYVLTIELIVCVGIIKQYFI